MIVATEAGWEDSSMSKIKVGDIIELLDGETVPADCVLLASKEVTGEAFEMTASLDGERNLKPKKAPLFVATNFSRIFSKNRAFSLSVETSAPIKDLLVFRGKMTVSPIADSKFLDNDIVDVDTRKKLDASKNEVFELGID